MKLRVAFVIGQYPPEERKLREQVALAYATPEIEIGILSTPASPYIRGMSPADIQMAAPLFIETFREAERQGYDAVVPLGMLGLGIDGGKSAVDIPVVGPFEACFHVASLVGDRFQKVDDEVASGDVRGHRGPPGGPRLGQAMRRASREHEESGLRAGGDDALRLE